MAVINSVLDWLDISAGKFGDKPAFKDLDENFVSFANLKNQAENIGSYIISKYNCTQQMIVVLTERNIESIPAFLGIVYSGNVYIPIDSSLPDERIIAMLEVASPILIINCSKTNRFFNNYNTINILDIEKNSNIIKRIETSKNLPFYGIFTSGSTGFPKLVLKNQSSIISFIESFVDIFNFTSNDIQGNQIPFYFDASTKDLFTTLKCGLTTIIIPKNYFSQPGKLAQCLQDNNITSIVWVPSALSMLSMFNVFTKFPLTNIKKVMSIGETLPAKQINIWKKALPNATFINLYGATENAGNCLYYKIDKLFEDSERVPIGKAFPNVRVFLLDDNYKEIASNNTEDIGEICVSGEYLALGYYNNLKASQEKIKQNPANNLFLEQTLFTGDVGKYDVDGNILYLSRKDFQIKLNGYRIELGDIEVVASSLDGITAVCCLFDEDKKKIILFYSSKTLNLEDSLKKYLINNLPQYMLPSKYVYLEKLPLNANGKIHRTELKKLI